MLDGTDKVRGVVEVVERAGIEPGSASRKDLDLEPSQLQIDTVQVSYLELPRADGFSSRA